MNSIRTFKYYRFLLLSLLFHILFILNFIPSIEIKQKDERKPSVFIPSYVAQEATAEVVQQSIPTDQSITNEPVSKFGINKPSIKQHIKQLKQLLPMKLSKNEDPVHLIGEDKIEKPLLTLLGKALTKHLVYPSTAVYFNVRGVSVIGFTLYPDGSMTDLQLLQSSGAGILDNQAMSAARAMAPLQKVGQYLKQPQFIVIGIIFGS